MIFCQSCGMPMTAPESAPKPTEVPAPKRSKERARHSKSARGITPCRVPRSSIRVHAGRHAPLRGDSDLSTSTVHPSCQGRKTSLPKFKFTTDNAAMITTAGYYRYKPEENLFPAKCESRQHALMIRRHNSAIFADLRRFLFCFIIIWFSDANIAILFRFIFVGFD